MKLNNKGWGLTDYLLIVSVIIIALLVASVLIIRLTNGLKENIKVNENNETKIEENNSENNENQDNSTTNEIIDSNTIDYASIEDEMTSAAIKYIEITYKNNIGEGLIIVDYPHILEVDSDIKSKMAKDNCNGYVQVLKNEGNIEFTSFIKCDNYSTEGVKDYYIN